MAGVVASPSANSSAWDLSDYKVLLDINQTRLYDSEIWFHEGADTNSIQSRGEIRLRVRADLRHESEGVSFAQTKIVLVGRILP